MGRNVACPGKNAQLRGGGYGEKSYGGRRGQIMWRAGNTSGGYKEGRSSMSNQKEAV